MSLNKRRLCSCRLFVSASFLFFLFLVEKAGIPMQKVSYVMLKVDVEIANICFVLLSLLGNGGCAGVTERRQLSFVGIYTAQFRWFICTLVGFTQ